MNKKVDLIDSDGNTALMKAAMHWRLEEVKSLIKRGADVNLKNYQGMTALMLTIPQYFHSVTENDLEKMVKVIKLLLKLKKIDVNIQNNKWESALMLACMHLTPFYGKRIVALLLDKGAKTDLRNGEGETAIMLAIRSSINGDKIEIVRLLLIFDTFVNAVDSKQWTPLMIASAFSNGKMVKLLLQNGADLTSIDLKGMNALIYATKYENKETLEVLLRNGAHTNFEDNKRYTSLMYANEALSNLTGINFHDDWEGVIRYEPKNPREKNIKDIINLLLEYGGKMVKNIKQVSRNKRVDWRDLISTFLFSKPPIDEEQKKIQEEIKKILEKGGNDVGDMQTILRLISIAVMEFDFIKSTIIITLLEEGAKINAKDVNGNTALILASKKLDKKTVELLLKKGADPTLQDNKEWNAIMYVVNILVRWRWRSQLQNFENSKERENIEKNITKELMKLREKNPNASYILKEIISTIPKDEKEKNMKEIIEILSKYIDNNTINDNEIKMYQKMKNLKVSIRDEVKKRNQHRIERCREEYENLEKAIRKMEEENFRLKFQNPKNLNFGELLKVESEE